VLNCWVTETNDTPLASKISTILAKSASESGGAIDLINDHDIDLAVADVSEQTLQARPVHGSARKPAIVIALPQTAPALMLLALDEGLASLPLGVQRVEILLKPLLGGLAGIDRAAAAVGHSPKNRGPDQRAPVINCAIFDNER